MKTEVIFCYKAYFEYLKKFSCQHSSSSIFFIDRNGHYFSHDSLGDQIRVCSPVLMVGVFCPDPPTQPTFSSAHYQRRVVLCTHSKPMLCISCSTVWPLSHYQQLSVWLIPRLVATLRISRYIIISNRLGFILIYLLEEPHPKKKTSLFEQVQFTPLCASTDQRPVFEMSSILSVYIVFPECRLMLIDFNWCCLMMIDADWGWLMHK